MKCNQTSIITTPTPFDQVPSPIKIKSYIHVHLPNLTLKGVQYTLASKETLSYLTLDYD